MKQREEKRERKPFTPIYWLKELSRSNSLATTVDRRSRAIKQEEHEQANHLGREAEEKKETSH